MRLIATLLTISALLLAGCGSSSSSSGTASTSTAATTASASSTPTALATAKFILHAGLAFGAFHHYIYGPIKAGDLKNPFKHKLTVLKAAAAAAFMVHEIHEAIGAAQSSPALKKFVVPLGVLGSGVSAALAASKGGNVSATQLNVGNEAVETLKSEAASAGAPIVEKLSGL